jgi:selT/selW/selH-like putative selenoprotein
MFSVALAAFLEEQFPDGNVEVVQKRDPGQTGNFEVTLNGELIHSKKAGGVRKFSRYK